MNGKARAGRSESSAGEHDPNGKTGNGVPEGWELQRKDKGPFLPCGPVGTWDEQLLTSSMPTADIAAMSRTGHEAMAPLSSSFPRSAINGAGGIGSFSIVAVLAGLSDV